MNDIEKIVKRPYNRKAFDFGLSTLHANLHIFEMFFLLHISYRLNIKNMARASRISNGI